MARWILIIALLASGVAGFDTSNSSAKDALEPIEAVVADWPVASPDRSVFWIPVDLDGSEDGWNSVSILEVAEDLTCSEDRHPISFDQLRPGTMLTFEVGHADTHPPFDGEQTAGWPASPPISAVDVQTSCPTDGDDAAHTPTTASRATVPVDSNAPSASAVVDTSVGVPLLATEATGGVDGPVVYAAVSNFAETALGSGTVELAGPCLLLGGAEVSGTGRPVIVWQFGTSWNDDESEVILPDGLAVPVGSTISAGGGFHGADQLDEFLSNPEALERINDCVEYDGSDNVFVIQDAVEVDS